MISIHKLAAIANERQKATVGKHVDAPEWSKIYSSSYTTFANRLLHACKVQADDPKGIDDEIFISHPERLFSKLSYLSVGDLRKSKNLIRFKEHDQALDDKQIEIVKMYLKLNDECEFSNLSVRSDVESISNILIAHGLSPVSDSIALLADIGRATRTARCFNLKVEVLLADISWMSSNRSIRQFNTLTQEDIDNGLRICLDKRRRLYDSLEFKPKVKEITPYARKNKIYYDKLVTISNYYKTLAAELWGKETIGSLAIESIKRISKPLYSLNPKDNSLPEHMKVFAQFPGVLKKMEEGLEDHLEILRSIAKHFNSFDEEIFTYFFAQYYAQDEFRGKSLKISPISETKFDKPFDDLDKYFQTWGEGHTLDELLASGIKSISSEKKLSAIYLPQYQIGDFEVLPYASLSQDISRHPSKDHELIKSELICLDYEQSESVIYDIIEKTPIIHRNRLFADLSSFILYCSTVFGEDYINQISQKVYGKNLSQVFQLVSEKCMKVFEHESNCYRSGNLKEVWKTWITNIESETQENYIYIPLHIYLLLLDNEDWNDENIKISYYYILNICIEIYKSITS
jgi:hypothetical protein